MKKIFYIIAMLFFGYVGLVGWAFTVNPSMKDAPPIALIIMGIIGTGSIFISRIFLKKIRSQTKR